MVAWRDSVLKIPPFLFSVLFPSELCEETTISKIDITDLLGCIRDVFRDIECIGDVFRDQNI